MQQKGFMLRGLSAESRGKLSELAQALGMPREALIRQILEDAVSPRPETAACLESLFGARYRQFLEKSETRAPTP